MNIGSIPLVKKMIRMVPLQKVKEGFGDIICLPTSRKVEDFVLKMAKAHLPDIFEEDVFRYRTPGTA